MTETEPLRPSVDSLWLKKEIEKKLDVFFKDPSSFSVGDARKTLIEAEREAPVYLKEKVNNETHQTIQMMKYTSTVEFASKNLSKLAKTEYLTAFKLEVKSKNGDEGLLKLIQKFIITSTFDLDELEPLISTIIPFIDSSDTVFMIVLSIFARFKNQTHPFLKEQLEILTLEENSLASFKLLSLLFSIDAPFASNLFRMSSLIDLLTKINDNNKTTSLNVIKSALSLLSSACVDPELRIFIIEKFLETLIFALRFTKTPSIQSLSGLVILKTWNFETLASKDIRIDNLCDIFVENLDSDSIEGLSYITLKKSIKARLRKDETFIFDLFQILQGSDNKIPKYGILTILANLSTKEEKNEITDLKKQAQKNLEETIEEDDTEIDNFRSDLVERRLIEIIGKLSQTKNISEQCLRLLYSITQVKTQNDVIVKQGGFHLLMKLLGYTESIESRNMGIKALALLITTSNPTLLFSKDSPKTAFNYLFNVLFDDGSFKQKDQFSALIALTNLALLESIGPLSAKQWEIIDSFLLDDNLYLRRAAIELISNLMQHKSNLVALFNFENNTSKKRFDVIVKYTKLEDDKSQSAALTALTFGVTIPFIAEGIVQRSSMIEYCTTIINEQKDNAELIERTLFILYYLVFYSEKSDSALLKQLETNVRLKNDLVEMVEGKKHDRETLEMALEIIQIVKFK